VPDDGNALGVILPESRLGPIHEAEPVDERLAGQPAAADPVVRVGDGAEIDGKEGADGTDAEQDGTPVQLHA